MNRGALWSPPACMTQTAENVPQESRQCGNNHCLITKATFDVDAARDSPTNLWGKLQGP